MLFETEKQIVNLLIFIIVYNCKSVCILKGGSHSFFCRDGTGNIIFEICTPFNVIPNQKLICKISDQPLATNDKNRTS
jgi:hypothetical protein